MDEAVIPKIRFSEMPQLDETGMNKQWIRYPRKKTEWGGRVYLLKVQGHKSLWQVQADQMKVAFGLPPLGVVEVFDEELGQTGCLIPWFANVGHLAQARWQDWATQANLRMMVRIGVFDGVIGNSDRVVSNILVQPDGTLMPIDEGEQERFELDGQSWVLAGGKKPAKWVKFRKQILQLMGSTLHGASSTGAFWLEEWTSGLKERVSQLPSGTVRPYYWSQLGRLDLVVKETLSQIQEL